MHAFASKLTRPLSVPQFFWLKLLKHLSFLNKCTRVRACALRRDACTSQTNSRVFCFACSAAYSIEAGSPVRARPWTAPLWLALTHGAVVVKRNLSQTGERSVDKTDRLQSLRVTAEDSHLSERFPAGMPAAFA